VVNLDSLDLSVCDRGGSMKSVLDFPKQFDEAMNRAFVFDLPMMRFGSVLIVGMGGSAVGGDILKALLKRRSSLFVEVLRGYELPAWVGEDTLIIGISYSGDTEETLHSCEEGLKRSSKALLLSSGGKLEEMALSKGIPHFKLPSGFQPRAALAYLSVPLLVFMERFGIASFQRELEETLSILGEMVEELSPEVPSPSNPAKDLALWLYGSVPVIYGDEGIGGVAAYRWKTQINENSKQPAYACLFPELDHNEIVGWTTDRFKGVFKVIALRHSSENRRTSLRYSVTRDLISDKVGGWREVEGRGKGETSLLYSLIYFGDFVSLYLAYLNGVDPTPVNIISKLKDEIKRQK